jgi:hypothetical protein
MRPDGDDESVDDIRAADDDVVRSAPRVRHSRPEGHTLGVDIAIEDRDGSSMRALHAALRRAERGEGQARLVFYGASHVASDLFTGVVRSRLQARFGDAGHGFVMPVAPWRSYRHQGVRIRGDEGGWESAKVRGDTRDIERFGLHGVFVETARRNAWAEVSTTSSGDVGRAASVFELFYYRQPRGGDLQVFLDGRPLERIRTRATDAGRGVCALRGAGRSALAAGARSWQRARAAVRPGARARAARRHRGTRWASTAPARATT